MRQLLKVNPEIIINVGNIAYIEVTGKGGTDIYFIGNPKPLHLNVTEAEAFRNYVSAEVTDASEAA